MNMKILVAFDGSESARRAVEHAAAMVDGGTLTVVSVAEILPQIGRAGGMPSPRSTSSASRI